MRIWIGAFLLVGLITPILVSDAAADADEPKSCTITVTTALELSGSATTAIASTVPYWQRQPDETCQQYEARVAANDYEMWGLHWCGQGPCYREFTSPTGEVVRSAGGFHRGKYWVEQTHGCWGTAP